MNQRHSIYCDCVCSLVCIMWLRNVSNRHTDRHLLLSSLILHCCRAMLCIAQTMLFQNARLSQASILSRWRNVSSNFHLRVATPLRFFQCQCYGNIPTGHPLAGASNAGCMKNRDFQPISGYRCISEMIQDTTKVTTECEQETVPRGIIFNDLNDP